MLRANLDIISAVAGMFILLPGLLSSWFLPDRRLPAGNVKFADILAANSDYMAAHWPAIMGSALLVAFGSATIITLLLHPTRPTVADGMRIAAGALPVYVLASMIQTLIVLGGLFLFILPGLYLVGRFICIAPVAMVEGRRNPLTVLMRSFHQTRGNGWRIILLLAVVLVVAIIISTAINLIAAILSSLLLPPDVARLIILAVGALVEAALGVAVALVSASVYRQLAAA